jgi:hypothetical protein
MPQLATPEKETVPDVAATALAPPEAVRAIAPEPATGAFPAADPVSTIAPDADTGAFPAADAERAIDPEAVACVAAAPLALNVIAPVATLAAFPPAEAPKPIEPVAEARIDPDGVTIHVPIEVALSAVLNTRTSSRRPVSGHDPSVSDPTARANVFDAIDAGPAIVVTSDPLMYRRMFVPSYVPATCVQVLTASADGALHR